MLTFEISFPLVPDCERQRLEFVCVPACVSGVGHVCCDCFPELTKLISFQVVPGSEQLIERWGCHQLWRMVCTFLNNIFCFSFSCLLILVPQYFFLSFSSFASHVLIQRPLPFPAACQVSETALDLTVQTHTRPRWLDKHACAPVCMLWFLYVHLCKEVSTICPRTLGYPVTQTLHVIDSSPAVNSW